MSVSRRYRTIVIDPPWDHSDVTMADTTRVTMMVAFYTTPLEDS